MFPQEGYSLRELSLILELPLSKQSQKSIEEVIHIDFQNLFFLDKSLSQYVRLEHLLNYLGALIFLKSLLLVF
jgi:hypothetical protein